jgi:hypothetical protein
MYNNIGQGKPIIEFTVTYGAHIHGFDQPYKYACEI